MDPTNPVVVLCAAGMSAEAQGRRHEARSLFEDAWRARVDDYDACVAAHYLARHQDAPEDVLRWSHVALEHALAADSDRVRGFLASLHLNLGRSHEDLGELAAARRHYELAAAGLHEVTDREHRDRMGRSLARALARVALETGAGDTDTRDTETRIGADQ
jgi:hypothetical protein